MVDYYSILSKAVNVIPSRASSEKSRAAIYRRALHTLNSQMRLLKPSLTETQIKDEVRRLLSAIEKLEAQIPPGMADFRLGPMGWPGEAARESL